MVRSYKAAIFSAVCIVVGSFIWIDDIFFHPILPKIVIYQDVTLNHILAIGLILYPLLSPNTPTMPAIAFWLLNALLYLPLKAGPEHQMHFVVVNETLHGLLIVGLYICSYVLDYQVYGSLCNLTFWYYKKLHEPLTQEFGKSQFLASADHIQHRLWIVNYFKEIHNLWRVAVYDAVGRKLTNAIYCVHPDDQKHVYRITDPEAPARTDKIYYDKCTLQQLGIKRVEVWEKEHWLEQVKIRP